jgi:ribose/xylose/arabinose/galactoside ABC-type transport system permease subunit
MFKRISIVFRSSTWGLAGFFALTVIVFSALSPVFRTVNNLQNVLSGHSHIAIMAVGMTFPLLVGGIDLSVGSIMALVGMVVLDMILLFGLPGWLAALVGLATGVLCGLINAFLIIRLRLQPFIATLATMIAFRGLTYAISGRQLNPNLTVIAITDPFYRSIDRSIGRVPQAFIYLIILVIATHFLLRYTRLGMNLYAVGGNETAARLAGIPVNRVKTFAYAMSGFCTALATIILTSRMSTSTESLGLTLELSAIAAAIVGGVSLNGGIGNTIGPALGAFLIGTFYIGLTLMGVTTYAQPVIIGAVLLAAVGYDRILELRRARRWLERQRIVSAEGAAKAADA